MFCKLADYKSAFFSIVMTAVPTIRVSISSGIMYDRLYAKVYTTAESYPASAAYSLKNRTPEKTWHIVLIPIAIKEPT